MCTVMSQDRKMARVPAGRDREKHRSSSPKLRGSGGAGHSSSGRVRKTQVKKSASDRKLESQKLRLAAREIRSDRRHAVKNKNTSKVQNQVPKADSTPTVAEGEETEDVALYKQNMLITPDSERKCSAREIEKIREALVDALEPLEDGCFPQFYNSNNSQGVLVLTCANEQTKQWLERTVPLLKPWDGAKLCVKPKGEVARGTKVLFKTPKLFAKTDPKKILLMLSTQNKTLETRTWRNVSAKSDSSGQTLVYVVDNRSLEAIRALKNKAYLGLGNVELVILDEEDSKQPSVDADVKIEAEDGKDTSVDTNTAPAAKAEVS
ncbi:uncharacterized protein LOC126210593 [Schistocerca nitens]|uniref:uncharacterized protein LOC126210593 n=1 Tax=Schistocerca nitens TaxID=7011 RepID=UPI0021183082|nr:uncharacterized protein LOC126210593 [Schistocerca nitens]